MAFFIKDVKYRSELRKVKNMDTITHGLSGALIGRVLSKRTKIVSPSACIAVGALAGAFPDSDILLKLISDEAYMWNHRGATHSLFLLPFWAALIAYISAIYLKNVKNKSRWFINNEGNTFSTVNIFKDLYLISFLGILAHIAGDVITSFGTMLLWPSMNRYDIGSVFIIDLFFSGILIVGLLLSKFFGKNKQEKSKIAAISGLVLLAYIGFTQYMKYEAKNEMLARVLTKHPELKNKKDLIVDAQPQMFLPTNWVGVVFNPENQMYYYSTMYFINLNNKEVFEEYPKWGKDADRAKIVLNHPKMEFGKWFMQHPYVLQEDDNCVIFSDMRYKSPYRDNVFTYGLCKDGEKKN